MSALAAVIACTIASLVSEVRVEVIAEAPLVANPVIVRNGAGGALWVVDRGSDGDALVVLERANERPLQRRAFVEHLIDVRGVVPLGAHRALVLEPPNLLDAIDVDEDGTADAVRVVGSGLASATGLAMTSDRLIHVAGAAMRFAWDDERALAEQSIVTMRAPVIAGGDERLLIADGSLIRREGVRLTSGTADDALAWFAPIGISSSPPAAFAFCRDDAQSTVYCITSDRRAIEAMQPIGERWAWSRAQPGALVLAAGANDGNFNDLDCDGALIVACGATAPDRRDGKIIRVWPVASKARPQETAALNVSSDAALCVTSALPDESARAMLRRALADKAIEVRGQALAELARRWRERPLTPESAALWSTLLASSSDCMTDEPRLARLVASALHALDRARIRAGQLAPLSIETSPLVARALIDLKLADLDEARAVIADLLRVPSRDGTLERVSAALRLNDRRPARLRLDDAPPNWDMNAAAQLDGATQRALRRLQWPGRSDALMDPEPPPTIADVIERGHRLYSNCLTCHGAAGRGQPGVYPPLAESPYVSGEAERLIAIVLHGLEGAIDINGQAFAGTMPPPPLNSDDDMAAILTYVRQAFGNGAEPVTKEMIARVRAKTGGRAKPWTMKELNAALAK